MALLIFYLLLALIVSFLCSIMEAVLLSTPISYLKIKEQKGSIHIKQLIQLKENVDRPLSAILSLNTIAHTVGAAGVGAQATQVFGSAYFGVVSAVLTILILVITEIIPKTLGANYWKELGSITTTLVRITVFIAYPLVIISAFLTRMISKKGNEKTTSREEISALANIGKQEGIFGEKENKIIQNLIRLKTIEVEEIMTPRVVASTADASLAMEDFARQKELLHFSRIPIYADNPENITGFVFRQDIFEQLSEGKGKQTLHDIKNDIVFVPQTSPVFLVWEILLEKKEHIAIVIDQYGGMAGLVTMEDIIETLLGFEIIDEKDTITDMQAYAKERWKRKQKNQNIINNYFVERPDKKTNPPKDTNQE